MSFRLVQRDDHGTVVVGKNKDRKQAIVQAQAIADEDGKVVVVEGPRTGQLLQFGLEVHPSRKGDR